MIRLAALAWLAGQLGLLAQGISVTGLVLDPGGAPIPNAGVVLRGIETRQSRTGIDGTFRFDDVAPGRYELRAEREAFQTHSAQITVGRRAGSPVRIRLRLATLRQEITINDLRNQVNTQAADNLDVVRLGRDVLDNLPAFGNDILAAITPFLDPAAGGPEIVVDGMASSEKAVSRSAIQEVRINQNPYSAEFTGMGHTRIEIITAPGSTQLHGGVNYSLRDHHLNARNAFAPSRPVERWHMLEGSLSGPIGNGNRTSFLLSGEYENLDLASLINARTPSGDLRRNAPVEVQESFFSARVNRQATPRQQVSLRYEFADESGRGLGVGGFVLPEAARISSTREHHVYMEHRGVITPRLLHEFQVRIGRHNSPVTSVNPGVPKLVVLDAFTSGGAQADFRSTENHLQFHEVFAWTPGRHMIRTGASSPDLSRRGQSDRTNFDGTFFFSSLDDYLQGRPFSFQQQQGNPHLAVWEKGLAAFFQDDYRVRPNLSLAWGVRWDWQNYIADRNNFSPRLAIAWAPGKSRKTVLRVGGGYFFGRAPWRAWGDTLRYDGTRLRDVLITNPGFPNPYGPGGTAFSRAPNIVRFAPDLRMPYSFQHSLTLERQVRKNTTLAVTWRRAKTTKSYRARDLNAPLAGAAVRPDPTVGVLRQLESSARQRWYGLEFTLRGAVTKYFNGTAQYSNGGAWNDSDGLFVLPADSRDLSLEWARSEENRRHRLNLAGTLKFSPWLNLGVVFSAASGNPYNLITGRDDNHDGFARDRPPGVPRNSAVGPGFANLDVRWSRELALDPKKKEKGPTLAVGVDAFNAINRFNPDRPVGNLSSPFFGHPVSSRPPRRLQISLRLKF